MDKQFIIMETDQLELKRRMLLLTIFLFKNKLGHLKLCMMINELFNEMYDGMWAIEY